MNRVVSASTVGCNGSLMCLTWYLDFGPRLAPLHVALTNVVQCVLSPPVTLVWVPRLRTMMGTFTSRVVEHIGVEVQLLNLIMMLVRCECRTLWIPSALCTYPVGNRSVVPPGCCGNGIPLTALSLQLVWGIRLRLSFMVALTTSTEVLGWTW